MEREQSPQLTGTNRSIDLLAGAPQHRITARVQRQTPALQGPAQDTPDHITPHATDPRAYAGAGLVAIARGQTPDPIPNSAVKTLSAHGTAAPAAEESVAARPAPAIPGRRPGDVPAQAGNVERERGHTTPTLSSLRPYHAAARWHGDRPYFSASRTGWLLDRGGLPFTVIPGAEPPRPEAMDLSIMGEIAGAACATQRRVIACFAWRSSHRNCLHIGPVKARAGGSRGRRPAPALRAWPRRCRGGRGRQARNRSRQ